MIVGGFILFWVFSSIFIFPIGDALSGKDIREKQMELDEENERLKKRIDDLETKLNEKTG